MRSDSQERARSTVRRARRVAFVQDIFSSVCELLSYKQVKDTRRGERWVRCV